jgi:glycosyltransferase involved in cell wall biosynthesis
MTEGQKILILVSVANLAGAQIAALRLARGLRDRGHDPKVVFLYEREPIAAPAHPFEVVLATSRPGLSGYARIVFEVMRLIGREKPDVVLTFLPLANALGQSAALLTGVRRRVVTHRIPVDTAGPLMRRLDTIWAWLGIYTGVVAVSEHVRNTCRHYPGWLRKRTAVVHNGLRDFVASPLGRDAARRRFGVPDGALALVAVGRLAPQKNYPLMLDVMRRLDNAILLIAGDGPLRPDIEARIAAAGIGDRVRLLGALPQAAIPDLLAAGDLFIQTSTFEGQSNAILEALHAGLPVVAHDIPEQRETIADATGAVAGALVPPGDVAAWAAAIERLRSDSRIAREIVPERAQAFGYDRMIAGFEVALGGAAVGISPAISR